MTLMLADPPKKATRLGVGLDANRRQHPNAEAWKSAIGTKPIAARLALLPDAKPRWDRIGVSAAFQLSLLIFCVLIPLIYPDQIKTALNMQSVFLPTPVTEVPVAPPPPPPKAVKAKAPPPKPAEVEPPKLDPKKPHIFEIPKAVVPKTHKVEALAPEMQAHLEAAKIETTIEGPKRPKEDVKMNNLNSGSAAPATVKAPVEKVQTGGFGDPEGIAGKGDPKHATNVNRLGQAFLPGGEGYGNGTGDAKGIRGTVASTGFGNGTANPPPSGGRQGKVEASGFGNQTVAEAPKKKTAAEGPIDTPVDILSKPKPEYTAEGRSLKLEGDVVLDVVFLSNGTMKVNRVISGLGHGLDEAAVRAAQQIKFKPAKREGQPVDFPARVRIEFRLAY
ncbi:MAG TPA: energy transducer TonB [Candidatus Solibacter sp.]|nr:energy transducer TonB [Candidatus Solibacter sp.]